MTIENRTIFENDNFEVLRCMDTDTVDLIYLDPPFNSNRTYSAPIGSDAAGAAFKDSWTMDDVKDEWHDYIANHNLPLYRAIEASEQTHSPSMKAYLIMMAVRMIEMKRVLKPTGSIYLHCDPTASHYLKMMMDSVFGKDNFRREIIWKMPRPSGYKTRAKNWIRNHDVIFYYALDDFTFNKQYEAYEQSYIKNFKNVDEKGKYWLRNGKKRYLGNGYTIGSNWVDIHSMQTQSVSKSEGVGYPTQKPLALLDRIIKASSNPGDLVLDPFCGCATTCVAAERLQRNWIGIDISPKAAELVQMRLKKEVGIFGEIIHRTDLPVRSDVEPIILDKVECPGCFELFRERNMTQDHIVPRSKGGTDESSNLQLLCQSCNSTKSNGTMQDLYDRNLNNGHINYEQYQKGISGDYKLTGNPLIGKMTNVQALINQSKQLEIEKKRIAQEFVAGFEKLTMDELNEMSEEVLKSIIQQYKDNQEILAS